MLTQGIDQKASRSKRGGTEKETKKAWDTQRQQWQGRMFLALIIKSKGEEDRL